MNKYKVLFLVGNEKITCEVFSDVEPIEIIESMNKCKYIDFCDANGQYIHILQSAINAMIFTRIKQDEWGNFNTKQY